VRALHVFIRARSERQLTTSIQLLRCVGPAAA